jgi:hypothetical protein
LLRDRRIWLPALAMVGTGIGFAFAQNFLAPLLAAVIWFWVPFAIGIALTRIIAQRSLAQLPARLLVASGLAWSSSVLERCWRASQRFLEACSESGTGS